MGVQMSTIKSVCVCVLTAMLMLLSAVAALFLDTLYSALSDALSHIYVSE